MHLLCQAACVSLLSAHHERICMSHHMNNFHSDGNFCTANHVHYELSILYKLYILLNYLVSHYIILNF